MPPQRWMRLLAGQRDTKIGCGRLLFRRRTGHTDRRRIDRMLGVVELGWVLQVTPRCTPLGSSTYLFRCGAPAEKASWTTQERDDVRQRPGAGPVGRDRLVGGPRDPYSIRQPRSLKGPSLFRARSARSGHCEPGSPPRRSPRASRTRGRLADIGSRLWRFPRSRPAPVNTSRPRVCRTPCSQGITRDLVRRFVEACRHPRTILPATTMTERICADALVDAERRIEASIAERVPPELRRGLVAAT